MNRRWITAPCDEAVVARLAGELDLPGWIARCLIHRGHATSGSASEFIDPRLRNLADPLLIPNLRAAVERLFRQRESGEPLVVFGDYDVDGVTSTAILKSGLERLGWRIHPYLPHRLDEGYGLSQAGVEACLERFPVSLLLAVDCGSTAVEPIALLRARGVDVLVLDHHQVSTPPPAALALVNPQLGAPEARSFRELCSAGLAFKLLHAVVKCGREQGFAEFAALDLREFLDLVALGTVADLVPLVGENRILVTAGLQRLTDTQRPGLVALKEVSGISGAVGAQEVGYQLGPRVNAAGRLETATAALDLLLATDLAAARPLAAALDAINRDRQALEREITEAVRAQPRSRHVPERDWVIVEGQPHWHLGVVGIVASRVLREFHRPTLILGGDSDSHFWRGSGRSIPGFDLAAALRECDDLLVKHGGHAMAAGVTLEHPRLDALRDRLNQLARASLTAEQLIPELRIDAWVGLPDLNLDTLEQLERLEPFGMENPPVQLAFSRVHLAGVPLRMGKNRQHVKLTLTDGIARVEAVWWNAGDAPLPTGEFDVAGVPQINEYAGRRTVQVRWLAHRPGGTPC